MHINDRGMNLWQIFYLQILVFIIATLLITYILLGYLRLNHLKQSIHDNFNAELTLLEGHIYHDLLSTREQVSAISSRTMIRQKLFEYYDGTASLDETRNFTQSKYVDGAVVYYNLLLAKRTDPYGNIIAFYQNEAWTGLGESLENDLFLFQDDQYYINIRNPIIHDGIRIGTDICVFRFPGYISDDFLYLEDISITKEAVENLDIDELTLSIPIGDTNFYVRAALDHDLLKNERQTIIRPTLILSSLFILLQLVISYFILFRSVFKLLRERDKMNDHLRKTVEERGFLLKEINHRVKNNLNLIHSYLYLLLQSSETSREEKRLELLQGKIQAISIVHEQLQGQENTQKIEINSYLRNLCDSLLSINAAIAEPCRNKNAESIYVEPRMGISLGLIFAELITNSIRHAQPKEELQVLVQAETNGDEILIRYLDNGRPYPEGFDFQKAKSLGLSLVTNLIRQHSGTLEYDFSVSKELILRFPRISADPASS